MTTEIHIPDWLADALIGLEVADGAVAAARRVLADRHERWIAKRLEAERMAAQAAQAGEIPDVLEHRGYRVRVFMSARGCRQGAARISRIDRSSDPAGVGEIGSTSKWRRA